MIIFVDNEHISGYSKPWAERMQAARLWIKYRLEDLSHRPCLIVRYTHLTPDLVTEVRAQAIFISGNSASRSDYSDSELAGLYAVIREQRLPMCGFCGGMQVMGDALGATLAPIGPLAEGEPDNNSAFAPGMKKEFGYFPVTLTATHSLLENLGDAPVFRHAHSWELKNVPEGFRILAETDITPVQMMVHETLPLLGTQFHPEYYTDEYPAGRTLIENFLRWANLK